MNAQVAACDAHLFPTRPAKRWRYHPARKELGLHDNPPEGASGDCFPKTAAQRELRLDVLDVKGDVVRTLTSTPEEPETPPNDPDGDDDEPPKATLTNAPGVQRAVWDLRYDTAKRIKGAKIDLGDAKDGPLAPPGTYTLRLAVDGRTFSTPLTVEPDPRVTLSAAGYQAQLAFGLELREAISRVTATVERLRSIRKQLTARLELAHAPDDWTRAARALVTRRCDALGAELHNPKAEVTYDILAQKGGAKLYSRLIALYTFLDEGDGASTQGQREVFADQHEELQAHLATFDAPLADVDALNAQAAEKKLPLVAK